MTKKYAFHQAFKYNFKVVEKHDITTYWITLVIQVPLFLTLTTFLFGEGVASYVVFKKFLMTG